VPEPVFIAPDIMADIAEYELLERERASQAAQQLPPPAEIAETADATAEPPPELAPLVALLTDLPAGTPAEQVIVGGRWAAAAYRLSLLALLGEPTEGDPLLAPLATAPLRLRVPEAEPTPVDRDEVARMTPATLESGDD
jgi:hypothetical protein